jgi:hypothetical protein
MEVNHDGKDDIVFLVEEMDFRKSYVYNNGKFVELKERREKL